MKNIYGINKDNEKIDGIFYLDREVDHGLIAELEAARLDLEKINSKSRVPLFVMIVRMICIGYAILVLCCSISVLFEKNFNEVWNNGKWLFISAIIALIVGVTIYIIEKLKFKKVSNSTETTESVNDAEILYKKCLESLNIPLDSVNINILASSYEYKDDKIKYTKFLGAEHVLLDPLIFIEDDSLCLGDVETVMKIPFNDIVKIVKLKKNRTFINWSKDELPKNNKYKGYKVINQNGMVFSCKVYQIVINNTFGEYELLIPEYEYDIITKLLNIQIEEE